ncbi:MULTISPECIES: hypothetical protein [unclassified Streptomyces]|uniref:hypothetical protein n=1 Tax=unclassified Streptomyces TaxID=2593676 RepID=UPI000DBA4953|nr:MULTISPECIES: hypothetical protein [unclassified Streptomyces]MYT68343.1 hypothetical protein [Streptomyces sp. SID8367]RAJ76979.1 hypothetical protein K377_06148 [Streptomyces sp. PsTaAH-137]
MRRPDRGTLRAAAFTALLVTVFLTVNTSVAQAADGTTGGGLLSPLELDTSEGVSLKGYELGSQGGSVLDFTSQVTSMIMSGLFTVVRVLVGLACWAVEVAYRFPLLKLLARPAQRLSEVYEDVVVDSLGLKGLLLAWAFVFGLVMVVRGKHAKGFGEIGLTLVIGAFAASVFVTPTFLLGKDGPILQAQSAAAEVAQKTVDAHSWGGKIGSDDPCAGMSGPALQKCYGIQDAQTPTGQKIAKPIQDAVTNATVVKPFMLLEYGRILDPGKAADRKAYQVHLKWVSGGYKKQADKDGEKEDDPCDGIAGPGKAYCERETGPGTLPSGKKVLDTLEDLTPGGKLLDEVAPILSKDDQQFAAFLKDLKAAGPVGKECADYAEQPSWWRVASVVMVFIAALLICALLLSAAVVLLGTSAVCAGAAAAGGVTFVWGMLPGPSRTVVWKWLALFGIAMGVIMGVSAFIPAVGITIDVVLTDGPDLMAERLLLIDVLALVGLAFHRRLLAMVVSFSQRLTLRMRYAKVGGSHMAGDSQLGAALAMSIGSGAQGGVLTGSPLRGRGATGLSYGTSALLRGSLAGLADGTGMPGDSRRLLADANAEASRGLAPIGLAVAGTRIAAGAAWAGLVGKNPGEDKLATLRKPTADGDEGDTVAAGNEARLRSARSAADGPQDRYRDENGRIVNAETGEVLLDQNTDRTLLSTRAHNRLVRLRGYRIAHQGGRMLYGATLGLPATARTTKADASQATTDARQQLRVWGNTVRRDGQAWANMLQQPAEGPQATGRRLTPPTPVRRTTTAPAPAPAPAPGGTAARTASVRPGRGGVAAPTWADMTAPSGPAAPGPRRPAPPASSERATPPAPKPSTGRVRAPRPRSRTGLGSTEASRRQAEAMFRRIEDSNNVNPPARPDSGSTDGEGGPA